MVPSFLEPLWLLALPLSLLPWIWPLIISPKTSAYFFSSFLFFPKESLHKRLFFSLQEFFLKLIRTLIIILLCFILAKPFWKEQEEPLSVWLIDDTFSNLLSIEGDLSQDVESHPTDDEKSPLRSIEQMIPSLKDGIVWKLSDLFTENLIKPIHTQGGQLQENWNSLTTHSINLSQIGNLVLTRLSAPQRPEGHSNENQAARQPRIHLVSDFQKSQFQIYQSTVQDIQWVFDRPNKNVGANLSLKNLAVESGEGGIIKLKGELYGQGYEKSAVELKVTQNEIVLNNQEVEWRGTQSQAFEMDLGKAYNRLNPIEVTVLTQNEENTLDNTRFYQPDRLNNPWVAIITSEGVDGVYRHGLHQIKSGLTANHIFSFLSTSKKELEQHNPDIIILLGDYPHRWIESLKQMPSKLFIPTRLEDWKSYASQLPISTGSTAQQGEPQALIGGRGRPPQWIIDWTRVPFAKEWGIRKVEEGQDGLRDVEPQQASPWDAGPPLYYSSVWNLWLLGTGVSPAWGPLYQDVVFVDKVKHWLKMIAIKNDQHFLGTFDTNNIVSLEWAPSQRGVEGRSTASWTHWIPGHYRVFDDRKQKTYHFSVNLPTEESTPDLMSDDELSEMQQFFDKKTERREQQTMIPAINQLREQLLWGLLLFLFIELFYLLFRVIRQFGATTGGTPGAHGVSVRIGKNS